MNELVEFHKEDDSGLTGQERLFLDLLFDKAGGDFREAMLLAGYPKDASVIDLRKKLAKHIKEASKNFLVGETVKAGLTLSKILMDPNTPGASNAIKAANSILERGDVNKEEAKFELPENAIVILPPKKFEETPKVENSAPKVIEGEVVVEVNDG